MIELAKNIELLLLENDCVIVPGLGGFIAHYQPAHYEVAEQRFYPPVRTIGFNPQLVLNDGLLAQAYMQHYHTDFPDATYRIDHAVEELKDQLFEEGRVTLTGVGELCFTMRHSYEFHPIHEGTASPSLYGLEAFALAPLGRKPRPEVFPTHELMKETTRRRRILTGRRIVGHVAAAVVAVVLFFALSSPVENTYVDNGNYASLGTHGLLDAIRSQSLVTSVKTVDQDKKTAKAEKKAEKAAAKAEKKAEKEQKKQSTSTSKNNGQQQNQQPTQNQNGQQPAQNQQNGQQPAQNQQNGQQPAQNQNGQQPAQNQNGQKPVQNQQPAQNQNNQQPAQNQNPQKPVQTTTTTSTTSTVVGAIYHLIVSSVTTLADAQKELQSYINKGYTNATIVEGNGRYRISLGDYSDKNAANKKLNELKQNSATKDAWLLRK
jgi:hypothetical protein